MLMIAFKDMIRWSTIEIVCVRVHACWCVHACMLACMYVCTLCMCVSMSVVHGLLNTQHYFSVQVCVADMCVYVRRCLCHALVQPVVVLFSCVLYSSRRLFVICLDTLFVYMMMSWDPDALWFIRSPEQLCLDFSVINAWIFMPTVGISLSMVLNTCSAHQDSRHLD